MRRFITALSVATLAMLLASLIGCGTAAPQADPAALQGVEWGLTDTSATSADLKSAGITASFDGTTLSGFSGVNQYTGPYKAGTDGSLEVGTLAATLMAGPEPRMTAEKTYLELLSKCDSFAVTDGVLTLSTNGNPTLTYEKAKPASLPGTGWTVIGYNNGKQAVTGPSVEATPTLVFGTDGTVSGFGGVNNFNGPFESTEKTVKIGPLAATMMAGPQELMDQETQYLAALENSSVWVLVQGRLEMRDGSGATQIMAVPQE